MTDFGKFIDANTVRFERLLPSPIERVWDYLTKPEYLVTWLGEGEMELRVGGQVELRFDVGEVPERARGGSMVWGVVTQYEPPRVLAYSWINAPRDRPVPGNPLPDSFVTFELEARGEHVLLVLAHRRVPTAHLPKFGAGWHTHLGILRARLSQEEPEPFLPVFHRLLVKYEQQVAMLEAGAQSE